MAKKRKRRRKAKRVDIYAKDYHHFLWTKRVWDYGWAKRLRDHPYCGAYLPQMTLHRLIHAEMANVPLPDQKACQTAYIALQSWLDAGWASLDDSPERKLEVIAKCFRAKWPKTAEALDMQRKIITEFYDGLLD